MPQFRTLILTALLLVVTLRATPATAQSIKYDLDNDRSLVQTDAPSLEGDAAVIARARRALAEDNPSSARTLLTDWITKNERTANAYLPQAYLLRGDSWVAVNDLYEALYDYETVIKQYPQTEEFVTAIDREIAVALRYANGEKRRTLLIFWVDASDIAVELFIRTQERLPGSQLAEKAAIELADYYYRERELRLAGESYDLYLENFPRGPNKVKAAQRRIFCDIARFKGPRYESASLIDASVRIKDFQRVFPAEAEKTGLDAALLTRLDESAAAQMLENARWYLKVNDEASARFVAKRLLKVHPGTIAADQAMAMAQEKGWEIGTPKPTEPSTTEPDTGAKPDDAAAAPTTSKPEGTTGGGQ